MKNKNKDQSALILLGTSVFTPFLQGIGTVAADESENKASNEVNTGAAKKSNFGLFTFFSDVFLKIFFSGNTKVPANPVKKPVVYSISLSSPENFVSTIYDKDIEEAVKATLKKEIEREIRGNNDQILDIDKEVNKRLSKMSEEEKIKRRVKEVVQRNYSCLMATREKFSSERGARVEAGKFSIKQRIEVLENGLKTLTSQLEELKKKVPNFKDISVKISKKQQLSEDEKKLIEKQNAVYATEKDLRDVKEGLDNIQKNIYKTSIKENVKVNSISKEEGIFGKILGFFNF